MKMIPTEPPKKKTSARSILGRIKVSYPRLRRILVPLDFSGRSRQALRFAIPLAQKFRARIVLFHAIEPAPVTAPELVMISADLGGVRRHAARRLDDMAATLLPPGVHDRNVVRVGYPAVEILATAERERVDLIVMSTQGRTGFKRFFVGGTAEQVMRHANCPVLSVRRQ